MCFLIFFPIADSVRAGSVTVFRSSLAQILAQQRESHPNLDVPYVLVFLTSMVISTGGQQTEGIFRIAANDSIVNQLRSAIESEQYEAFASNSPHVYACLLKQWLRELEKPLIPPEMYKDCIDTARGITPSSSSSSAANGKAAAGTLSRTANASAAADSNDSSQTYEVLGQQCVQLVQKSAKLPAEHRRTLLFLVRFLRSFLTPEASERTKMSVRNLAIVFAPTVMLNPDRQSESILGNTDAEADFLMYLFDTLSDA